MSVYPLRTVKRKLFAYRNICVKYFSAIGQKDKYKIIENKFFLQFTIVIARKLPCSFVIRSLSSTEFITAMLF